MTQSLFRREAIEARRTAWLGGIVLYYQLPKLLPGWGSALPTLGVCFALARLTRPR